jgi:hypothetical protein
MPWSLYALGAPHAAEARSDVWPISSAAPPQHLHRQFATFCFDRRPGMPLAEQDGFKDAFYAELASIRKWAGEENWRLEDIPDIRVHVGDRYKISKSLAPAWHGYRGYMEFPTGRVVTRRAAIAHELIHVFFPNGNRFLAEGLAVYLQHRIGGNPAFPNFGRPLHALARDRLCEMVPEFTLGDTKSLDKIHLAELDEIATPSPLTLKVGQDFHGEEPRGQALIYPIAGSFVQFLIEIHGMKKFRALCMRTPLVPFERTPGLADRWIDIYGRHLADLEFEWKSLMVSDGLGLASAGETTDVRL